MSQRRRLPLLLIVPAILIVLGLLGVWLLSTSDAVGTTADPESAFQQIEAELLEQLRDDDQARRVPGLRVRGGGVGLLRGRVVRAVKDRGLMPVPGLSVQVLWHRDSTEVLIQGAPQQEQHREAMVTDNEGVFRFERLAAFVGGAVLIRHDPFRPILRRGVSVLRDQETDLGDLVLGAPSTLRGEVLDSRGRPLRGAQVQVLDDRSRPGRIDIRKLIGQLKSSSTPIASVEADEAGQFLISDLQPGRYVLRVAAPGYTTAFRSNVVVTLDERSSAVRVVLDVGAGFEGRVVNEAGDGIGGARMLAVVMPGSRIERVDRVDGTSDADGYYRLDQLVPGNRYFLHAWADGYAPSTSLVAPKDGTVARDIVLLASGRVEGVVLDAATGRPIPAAEVSIVTGNIAQPGPVADVANADGHFVLAHVRPGPIIAFTASAPGYQQAMTFDLGSVKGMTVKAGETTEIEWTLHPGGKVGGRVTSTDGRAVPHASVALAPRDRWKSELTTLTDVSGRYEIVGVGPGRFHLRVSAVGLSPIARDQDAKIEMPKELGVLTKDVVLDTGATLTGMVLSPEKEPVGGARVFLETRGSREVRDRVRDIVAISGPTGAYKLIGVPPGVDLTLLAEHDAYVRTASPPMTLRPGEQREIAVNLRAGATLELTVVGERDQLLEGARVRWGHVRPEDESRARDSFRADELLSSRVLRTDIRGFVVIDGLRPGKTLVKIEHDGYSAWYRRDAAVPEEGNAAPIGAKLIPAMQIQGRVVSAANNQPIKAAFVYAREIRNKEEPDTGRVQAFSSAETAADGTYTLEGIAPGGYEVIVWYAAGHIGAIIDRRNKNARRDASAGAKRVDFTVDPIPATGR